MDLDNFKDINDTYGHHVGDRALREIAGVLRAAIRPYDICVRYAGDEFIVVLSGCGGEEAERKRLELQRRRRSACEFEARPGKHAAARDQRRRGGASRTTATPTRRCWRPPTAACIATRPGASGELGGGDGAHADPRAERSVRSPTVELRKSAVGIL